MIRRNYSLSAMFLALMISGLIIIQIVFFFVAIWVRGEAQFNTVLNDRARTITAMYELLEVLEPQERLLLARRTNLVGVGMNILDAPGFSSDQSEDSERFLSRIQNILSAAKRRQEDFQAPQIIAQVDEYTPRWHVTLFSLLPATNYGRDQLTLFRAKAALQLDHGQWAVFFFDTYFRLDNNLFWLFSEMFVQLLLLILLTVLVARFVTRPLTQLHNYTEEMIPGEPETGEARLPEKGPREVVRIGEALKDLNKRINKFVSERVRFLASISHDLRTPVHRMRLYLEMDPQRKYQPQLLENLDDLQNLANNAIEIAKSGGNTEPPVVTDIGELVDCIVTDRLEAAELEGDLTSSISFAQPVGAYALIRPQGFRRCLENILENALKYGNQARIDLEVKPGEIILEILDNGPGIPEADLEKVFTPFYRGGGASGGHGLGLGIARELAEQNGASLDCRNSPGGGLCVRISLKRYLPD